MPHLPVELKRWLIKILIELTGRSASSIATLIGIHRSALTEWLKGRTTLGAEFQDKVLKELGIVEGEIDRSRVHLWKISEDLSNFQRLLSFIQESSLGVPEIVRIGPITPHPIHLSRSSFSESLYAIKGLFRALVRRSIPPTAPAMSVWNIEKAFRDNLTVRPVLDWMENIEREGEFGNEPTIRIDTTLFNKWWGSTIENQNISLEEFDAALGGNTPSKIDINPDNLEQVIKIIEQVCVDYHSSIPEKKRLILLEASEILRDLGKQGAFEGWSGEKSNIEGN